MNVTFANDWQGFFEKAGFNSYDDFFNYEAGVTVNKNQRRDVTMMTLAVDGCEKTFFMKRFHRPYYKDMLHVYFQLGRFACQGQVEWENAHLLLRNDVDTYRPACVGTDTKCGLEKRSFFITEELKGQCFTDYLAKHWHDMSDDDKQKMLAEIAAVVRRFHDANINLPDLYMWHFFIEELGDGDYKFAVIDLHRLKRNVKSFNQKLCNLGRLYHSMIDKYFTEEMRIEMLKAYAGDDCEWNFDKMLKRVRFHSWYVSLKRNPKPY